MKTLIIGSGIAGLACAGRFASAGHEVTLVDKGNRLGGRMSTRVSRSGPVFDHGCQYFTAKSATFERQVDRWVNDGHAAVWDAQVVDLSDGQAKPTERDARRYVGTPRMDSVLHALLDAIDKVDGPHFEVQVASLRRENGLWTAIDQQGGERGGFERVVVATPAEQAKGLTADVAPQLTSSLREAETSACWAAMLSFDQPLELAYDAAFVEGGPLSWFSNNTSKPGRPDIEAAGECWVLHGSPEWSDQHVEDDAESVLSALRSGFEQVTGIQPPEPTYAAAHRWRYAHASVTLGERYLIDEGLGIGVCGDACADSSRANVERAYLSGLGLAEHIAGY